MSTHLDRLGLADVLARLTEARDSLAPDAPWSSWCGLDAAIAALEALNAGDDTRAELLGDMARKPVRKLAQIDVHLNWPEGDAVAIPDADSDAMFGSSHLELRSSDAVIRLQYPVEAAQADVLRALRKLTTAVEGRLFHEMMATGPL